MFDTKTLLFASGIALGLSTLIMGMAALERPEERAAKYWTAAYGVSAIAVALYMVRPYLSPFVSYVISNLVSIAGVLLLYVGIAEFVGWRKLWGWAVAIFIISGISLYYWTAIVPNVAARIVVVSVGMWFASTMVVVVLVIRRSRFTRRLSLYLVLTLLSTLAIATMFRIWHAIVRWNDNTVTVFDNHPIEIIWFALLLVTVMFSTIACVLMITQRHKQDLDTLAMTDELTGLLNRRAFFSRASEEHARAVRSGIPYTIILFDLDNFKWINDTYGHWAGDEMLRRLATTLGVAVRREDVVARYGGEEFCILLTGASMETAFETAERIRVTIANMEVETGSSRISTTASFGIASFELGADIETVLIRADEALYRAKHSGRNRVMSTARELAW